MLKDKTSSLEGLDKAYILKFWHIELEIGEDIHSKILEYYTSIS